MPRGIGLSLLVPCLLGFGGGLGGCAPVDSGTSTFGGDCPFSSDQSAGLTWACTYSGTLPKTLINPSNPSDKSCRAESFIVYDQTFSTNANIVYGEANDETQTRVRIGTTLSSGTHSARVAKAVGQGCTTISGPISTISTSFAGKHTALVDRVSDPSCVFQSMLGFTSFSQSLDVGLPLDISAQTRAAIRSQLEQQMDLEVAKKASAYHHPATVPDDLYTRRWGRCADGYQAFTGP